jgi:hypothetical protein
VLDITSALTDAYYTRKYGAISRRLGRPGPGPDRGPGFIIIQIDGLSHEYLEGALAAGAMPYLRRLVRGGRLSLGAWRCGVPSTTPAVQAGIMFGNRFDIPGFRWYEKERRTAILTKRPAHMRELGLRLSKDRRGILTGGSCYASVFDGDADLALFTMSSFGSNRFFESVRGLGILLLFLLSPVRVLRLLGLVSAKYLAGVARRVFARVRPGVVNPFDVFSPLLHAVSDALLTEAQTFGVMLDIYRRVPAIYANYTAYDEVAHKFGPDHQAAYRVLHEIDRRIRQVDRMRARYRRQLYDLYVLSDHGNTPSAPFSWRRGVTLGRLIDEKLGESASVNEMLGSDPNSTEKARFVLDELAGLGRRLSPRLRRVFVLSRLYVRRRLLGGQQLELDLQRHADVVVRASGPLAHIYFNVSPRPLDLVEIMLPYSRLLDELLATDGIGAVVGRAGLRTVVLGGQGGVATIGPGCKLDLEGPDPLAQYGDTAYASEQLHRLLHFPHAGDVVVLGAVEPDGTVVTFEKQVATHGGLGGSQDKPFIAWPAECQLDPGQINDAVDLYPYFARHYLVDSPGQLAGAAVRAPTFESAL